MTIALLCVLGLTSQIYAHTFHLVASSNTPLDLGEVASKAASLLSSPIQYTVGNLTVVENEKMFAEEGVVLDYTYDKELSALLRQRNSDVLVMWSEGPNFIGAREYGEIFSRYFEALQFTRVTLVSDSKQSNLQLSQFLIQTFPSVYEEMHIIPYNADEEFCLQFVGQMLKPSGANLFAIVTDEVAAMNLLSAFEAKKLNKEGYAFVLSKQASYYRYLATASTSLLSTGILYVADTLSALTRNFEEAEELLLVHVFTKLENGQTVTDVAKANYNQSFVLVNIENSIPRIVAAFPEEIELNGLNISFPGNTSIVPSRTMAVIPTSVNYKIIESTGNESPVSRVVMRGIQVAFEEVNNNSKIIPNFIVDDYPVGFSGQVFDYTFAKSQILESLDHLGVIHFAVPSAVGIIGAFRVFKDLNITKPISAACGDTVLSSPTEFPLYMRVKTTNAYTALVMARMFSHFGWKRAAILYSDDQGDNQDFYENFMNLTTTFGINITNDETMRVISPYLAGPNCRIECLHH